MSSPFQTVALAGLGTVGKALLPALVDAGFDVTVLTRAGSKPDVPSSVKTVTVDYEDVPSLTNALKGQDAVISTIATFAIYTQNSLVDAAIAAGVKRFIPSEFGSNFENERTIKLPLYAHKAPATQYLVERVREKGVGMTYSIVVTNAFLDFCIKYKLLIDPEGKKMELMDGGETPFTTTPLPFVAKGVAAILKRPEETRNRVVRLHGAGLTQRKLLGIAKKVVGEEGWDVTEVKSEEVLRKAEELYKKEPKNVWSWIMEYLKLSIYGEGYGGDLSKENDNELLGLKALNDKEIEEVVRECAKSE